MVFLYYLITIVLNITICIFWLLLFVALSVNSHDASGLVALAVAVGFISVIVLLIRCKIIKNHDVQRYLSQRAYDRKMKKINIKYNSAVDSVSASANKKNMLQMASIIKVEVKKRKEYITPDNLKKIFPLPDK